MSKIRIEDDLLGDREVPDEAYCYGVHMLRPHCFISIPIETAITAIGTNKGRFFGSGLYWLEDEFL